MFVDVGWKKNSERELFDTEGCVRCEVILTPQNHVIFEQFASKKADCGSDTHIFGSDDLFFLLRCVFCRPEWLLPSPSSFTLERWLFETVFCCKLCMPNGFLNDYLFLVTPSLDRCKLQLIYWEICCLVYSMRTDEIVVKRNRDVISKHSFGLFPLGAQFFMSCK